MMKKVFNILKYIVIVAVAFSLLTMLFMPKYIEKNADGRITPEFYREKTPLDVVFVGSSTVHAGISPMTLYKEGGLRAYDRSNSSQVIALSYYMAKEAIRCNKPKLIVCEVGFIYQEDDYVDEGSSRKSLDGMKWSKEKVDAIKAMIGEEEHFIDYVFPILRFHSRWNDLCAEDIKYLLYKPTVTYNGQLLQFKTISDDKIYDPYGLEEGTIATERSMYYLQKLVDLCNENDVELALIKLPMINGNWCNSIDDQIQSFADKNGVLYKNFIDDFDSIGFNMHEDFTDGQHMNSIGAEKFTKVLYGFLNDNYSVLDKSSEETKPDIFVKKLNNYNYAIENKIPSERGGDDL
ncbi:MAG: hypothetical protein Q4D29_05390 [Lachnospiraceae bacterium]|nr:hypothetical protein [Lachnospiraceae bacterium]